MTNKAVLFDLDGVLVDACDWHYEALNRALKQVANYEISREDHMSTYNGLPTKRKLKSLADLAIIREADIEKISDLKQDLTVGVIEDFCSESVSKIALMKTIKAAGYKIGCVTNSIRRTAGLMLIKTGIMDFFDVVITNEQCANNKPHPEPYITALVQLNALPHDSIIVEDSPKGLEAARLTGCRVLEVKNATEVTKDLFKDKL
jgi:beta-phosphoglucomutase